MDDSADINQTWDSIAKMLGEDRSKVREGIEVAKDMYIILDHSRTLMMIMDDGGLPSNVGGGANVRNILRRMLTII